MRIATLVLTGALGLAATAVSATAAPAVPNLGTQHDANIVQVWGGCGWGLHPNRWGACVPNRYGYGPYGQGYNGGGYNGGGYYGGGNPYWRERYWHGY